ncbi:hypothetical protein JHK82_044130 [Glycine max]|uniref:Uncharacterized protein n=1 Tax=Glycine max TaxID=3847 RepID=A0A0R0GBI8_SOYBN|nr:hypothetical protein JHK85_058260 [Glycine max]KAG4946750.1 hypothetical protein JHK87_042757 [Glycine soja]KAG4906070.1 hypothetical protein JHK85_058261 [Glycine max]KAG4906073.1 hypothetical protein JHK85_058264 [Glycine max]KAG4906075.1 hypothetical protein JHK85_058266 [Glycine max]
MRVMDGSDHPLIGNALPCTKIGNFAHAPPDRKESHESYVFFQRLLEGNIRPPQVRPLCAFRLQVDSGRRSRGFARYKRSPTNSPSIEQRALLAGCCHREAEVQVRESQAADSRSLRWIRLKILTKHLLRNFSSPRSMRLKARLRVAPLQDWQQADLLLDPSCATYTRIRGPKEHKE